MYKALKKRQASQPVYEQVHRGEARAWRGVWQKRRTSARTGARQKRGRLSQMLVATMPGDTEAVVSGRPASRARRCSSAAVSTLQSLERAYRRYLQVSSWSLLSLHGDRAESGHATAHCCSCFLQTF